MNGAQGDPGERGDRGDRGDRGVVGERGEKGDHGQKGDKGMRGPAFSSWFTRNLVTAWLVCVAGIVACLIYTAFVHAEVIRIDAEVTPPPVTTTVP